MSTKLPNAELAQVAETKVTQYLLSTDRNPGAAKARYFMAFGFRQEQWQIFANALAEHAQSHPVAKVEQSRFGTKFEVVGPIQTPDGRNPTISSVWQIDRNALAPRLISAYPYGK